MAQIENTPIWLDIEDTMHSGPKLSICDFRAMIHTVKEDFSVIKVSLIDITRDYVNNIGDIGYIEFKLGLGDYMTRLYPYKDNLEVSVKRITLEEGSGRRIDNSKVYTERYKAVFMPKDNPHTGSHELEMHDPESMNKVDMVEVKLQLLNRSMEPLRIKTCSGVYRNVTAKQLIGALLLGESKKVHIDGKASVDGLDMVEPNNTSIIPNAVIPQGTHISSIPTYTQEVVAGVYNAGIGTYLQQYQDKLLWWVYPLFNTQRFDQDVDKVIFFAVPKERLPGADRTYKQEGNLLKILANSLTKYQDAAETDYMNHGVGFRMAHADAYMKKPVEMTAEGPVAQRTRLNYEIGAKDRKDGLNYAPMVTDPSSNPFKEYSKVAARSVARIDLVWENAFPELLYPAMPCKYVYMGRERTQEVKGVIMHVKQLTCLSGQGINNSNYRTSCAITILVEPYQQEPKISKILPAGEY